MTPVQPWCSCRATARLTTRVPVGFRHVPAGMPAGVLSAATRLPHTRGAVRAGRLPLGALRHAHPELSRRALQPAALPALRAVRLSGGLARPAAPGRARRQPGARLGAAALPRVCASQAAPSCKSHRPSASGVPTTGRRAGGPQRPRRGVSAGRRARAGARARPCQALGNPRALDNPRAARAGGGHGAAALHPGADHAAADQGQPD